MQRRFNWPASTPPLPPLLWPKWANPQRRPSTPAGGGALSKPHRLSPDIRRRRCIVQTPSIIRQHIRRRRCIAQTPSIIASTSAGGGALPKPHRYADIRAGGSFARQRQRSSYRQHIRRRRCNPPQALLRPKYAQSATTQRRASTPAGGGAFPRPHRLSPAHPLAGVHCPNHIDCHQHIRRRRCNPPQALLRPKCAQSATTQRQPSTPAGGGAFPRSHRLTPAHPPAEVHPPSTPAHRGDSLVTAQTPAPAPIQQSVSRATRTLSRVHALRSHRPRWPARRPCGDG